MACITQRAGNVVIEPVNLFWGNAQLACIETIADNTSSLNDTYFTVSNLDTNFHIWLNIAGAGTDPAPANSTGIEVAVAEDASAVVIAAAIASAVNAVDSTSGLHAKDKSSGGMGEVLIEAKEQGAVLSAWADVDTGFTVSVLNLGSLLEIGLTEGGVSLGTEVTTFDVQADQTGDEIINKILTANSVGPISVVMKETIAAKLKELIEVSGDAYTPVLGTTPSEVSGWGSLDGSKQYSSAFNAAQSLLMQPVSKALSDKTESFYFWKAYPRMTDLSFSGNEDRKLTVEFDIFLDEARVNKVNKFVFGDYSQNFLK